MTAAALPADERFRVALDASADGRREEPEFLRQIRSRAGARSARLGLPGPRDEAWRFIDLEAVREGDFRPAADDPPPADTTALPPPLPDAAARLCFYNGRYLPDQSRVEDLPEGVRVLSLAAALAEQPETLKAYLDRLPGLQEHPFAALNAALFGDAAVIVVPGGRRVERPLQLVFHHAGAAASYPRVLALLGRGAELTLLEDHLHAGAGLCCPLSEIDLGADAGLGYYRLQGAADNGPHLGGLRLRLADGARFDGHCVSAGGPLNRVDIDAELDGEHADLGLRGLSLLADGEQSDYHVRVAHRRPHGSSRQIFRGVLDGRSRSVYDGLIAVAQDAQKTAAMQNSRMLLLSKRALAQSNPRLEILADDVQCAHGATAGFLDPEALFYLRSRGIAAAAARAMLVYAFANEQIEAMALPALRERLAGILTGRLF